ncbi:hypothetical protein EYF80_053634 [Liparis tanakae]|uniref:Uncharacterized protein n=1 Tax=Liparis tanakae TaxID=230148 RepID=A0A4Z2F775_9TELE|nr:hypothetical protein EYF80_053634 [Liparis tanakae]
MKENSPVQSDTINNGSDLQRQHELIKHPERIRKPTPCKLWQTASSIGGGANVDLQFVGADCKRVTRHDGNPVSVEN